MISAISVSSVQASSLADLTDERAGTHGIQCLVEDVEIALRNALRCRLVRQPSRRSVDAGGDAREFVRSALHAAGIGGGEVPSHALVSSPGLVVRHGRGGDGSREASHELSVFRIRTGRSLTADGVDAMVNTAVAAILPERSFRTEEVFSLDAIDSVRIVAFDDHGGAVIVGACGVVGGAVLAGACGVGAGATSVILLELRLDALLMLRKGIDDVRLLRSSDPAVVRQMRDLGRFRAADAAARPAGLPEPAERRLGHRNENERVTHPDRSA